jgi:hypothetical protein
MGLRQVFPVQTIKTFTLTLFLAFEQCLARCHRRGHKLGERHSL